LQYSKYNYTRSQTGVRVAKYRNILPTQTPQ
jgi:hypothetical protein